MQGIRLSIILMIAITAGLTGCASSGSDGTAVFHDPGKLNQIRVNKSTKQEVKNILGTPKSIIVQHNKTESWIYESTESNYTDMYTAKQALSFVPVPYLGTVLALADTVVDTGPDKIGETKTLSLVFSKNGVLKEMKRETERF